MSSGNPDASIAATVSAMHSTPTSSDRHPVPVLTSKRSTSWMIWDGAMVAFAMIVGRHRSRIGKHTDNRRALCRYGRGHPSSRLGGVNRSRHRVDRHV